MTIYSYPVMHFEREIQTENRNFNVNSTANGSDKTRVLNIKNIYLLNLSTSLGGKKFLLIIFLLQKLILLEKF